VRQALQEIQAILAGLGLRVPPLIRARRVILAGRALQVSQALRAQRPIRVRQVTLDPRV